MITRTYFPPAGEFQGADHHAISFNWGAPSELGVLRDGIELGD